MPVSVVNIDDSAAFFLPLTSEALEKRGLGLEVLLHRLVIIEMILCEIGENGCVEVDPARAMLHERVARNLHGHGLVSGIDHLGENFLKVQGFGSGARSIHLALPNAIFDGSNEAATALVGV